jgi:pimeloyl-ACP methyl ester carboxylesterase
VLIFACAHLTDERLFAHAVSALRPAYECRAFAFRDFDSLAAMANDLLAHTSARFTLIGLSLGGYLAFEVLRRAPERVQRLALLDTTAGADTDARRQGRMADIAKVQAGGIDALIPELPGRWLHPDHRVDPALVDLMSSMARNIGARGQFNQSQAMLKRPESFTTLRMVRVPTLILCGAQDPVTPLADHEAMRDCVPGARLVAIDDCGHLSTIEQPDAVTAKLQEWLRETDAVIASG